MWAAKTLRNVYADARFPIHERDIFDLKARNPWIDGCARKPLEILCECFATIQSYNLAIDTHSVSWFFHA